MNIKMSDRLVKLLKEAKIKLMVGGILGVVTFSGGAATISYAQNNNALTGVEYNNDINLDDKVEYNLPLYGYHLENNKYDVGLDGSIFENLNAEDYVYDMYLVDDLGNVIKTVCENAPVDSVNGMVDAGKYYAVIKNKNINEVYGQTQIIDTSNLTHAAGNLEQYEYAEYLNDYLNGKLTLKNATHIGGANSFYYDAIARGINLNTGLDFEKLRDTIINLNINTIAGSDSEQLDILYPEGVNYRRLEENTDYILWNLSNFSQCGLSNFAGEEADYEVLSVLDSKYIKQTNTLSTTSYDCNELKKCLNFFLNNREINGYKFEDLSDGGKKLALVSYDRFRYLISKTYNDCVKNDVAIHDDYCKLYQMTNSMNMLSVATYLESTNLVNGYYNLISECLNVNQTINLEEESCFETTVDNIRFNNELKNLNLNEDVIKSTLFVNYLNKLDNKDVIKHFGSDVDIHTEFENMEQYLNSVLKHNATNDISKSISLIDVCAETDKNDIAHLEAYYNTLKFELNTNRLNEKHVSAVLRWTLEYYNGFYVDSLGEEVKYMNHLTNGGVIIADNILNQYKLLTKNINTTNPEINSLVEQINNINLMQETKAAEQIIYSDFEELQQSINYYTVKKGDVLWKIALEYGMLPQELYDLNRDVIGDNPNLIIPGQKLKTNLSYDYEEQFRK